MNTKRTASLDGARLLNVFVGALDAHTDGLRAIAGEAERLARDSALIALDNLRLTLSARGITIPNEEIAGAIEEATGQTVETKNVKTLAKQARVRREKRNGKNAFVLMETTIKDFKRAVRNGNSKE